MAAKDHTSKDQFIDVFHASRDVDAGAPHERDTTLAVHPHALFGGTEKAALDRVKGAISHPTGTAELHHYRVPRDTVSPVIYGDDIYRSFSESDATDYAHVTAARGQQPISLWETTPVDASQVGDEVLQYRNAVEDAGSISYVMPKKHIQSGRIQYMGTRRLTYDDYRDSK